MTYEQSIEQKQIYKMAKDIKWDVLLTLTFPWQAAKKSHDEVGGTLSACLRHVEGSCYGRKAKYNKLLNLPFLEYSHTDSTHLHVLLVKPSHIEHAEFQTIIKNKWARLSGTGKANMKTHGGFYKVIRDAPEDQEKVLNYCSKDVSNNYDTMVIQCMNLKVNNNN